MKNGYISGLARTSAWFFGIKVAGLFKMSYVVGSFAAFFSAAPMLTPLVGAFGGVPSIVSVFGTLFLVRMLTGSFVAWHIAAFYVPGMVAALYWSRNHWSLRVALPLVCMILFMVHPVGFAAMPYSFYWFIPVALYATRASSLFATALGSTFTAHAVGSVIWLYAMPMTPAHWLALIPVVALERLAFAIGMVLFHGAISYGMRTVRLLMAPRASSDECAV